MDRPVNLSFAEVVVLGAFILLDGAQSHGHQLRHTLVLGGGDGHHRHTQPGGNLLNIDTAAAARYLVHHVEGHHHGHL